MTGRTCPAVVMLDSRSLTVHCSVFENRSTRVKMAALQPRVTPSLRQHRPVYTSLAGTDTDANMRTCMSCAEHTTNATADGHRPVAWLLHDSCAVPAWLRLVCMCPVWRGEQSNTLTVRCQRLTACLHQPPQAWWHQKLGPTCGVTVRLDCWWLMPLLGLRDPPDFGGW